MPPKRKADTLEGDDTEFVEEKEKKPRKSRAKKADAPENVAGSSKDAETDASKPKTWKEVKLPGEDSEVRFASCWVTQNLTIHRMEYRCSAFWWCTSVW